MRENGKITRNTVATWSMIGLSFVAVIVYLLCKFLSDGKENTTVQSQDKLLSYASVWAERLASDVDINLNAGEIFKDLYDNGESFANNDMVKIAKTICEKTEVSHVYFCEGESVICDETGVIIKGNLADFAGSEKKTYVRGKISNECGEPSIVSYVPMNGDSGEYVLTIMHLADISADFRLSAYEEASFLAITAADGTVLGTFSSHKDTDSMYLDGNIFTDISKNTVNNDYNVFRVKMLNGLGAAVESNYLNDERTICVVSIGVEGWYLAFGVRQSSMNKLRASYYSDIQSTIIKLAIAVSCFSAFVIAIIIINMLKSKEKGKVLEDKAETDLLTDLYNKAATERKIQEYMEENPNGRGLMFILDIDNFKKVNDTMGHAFGDVLLKTLGKEIKTEFRVTDIVGRMGGDEFMIFLKNIKDDSTIEREAGRITNFFHDFRAGEDYVKYSASASIGAAIFPDDATNFKDMYIAADQALYKAKQRGKSQLAFYNEAGHGHYSQK